MKIKFLNKSFIILLLISVFTGCNLSNNDDENPQPVDNYLVGFEKQKSFTSDIIKSLLQNFISVYPEFQDILDEVEHDVSVYKITYMTTFQGEELIASGLVSLPTTQSVSFPILSFQNGTNTLHRDAPSVNSNSSLFLMLEFIASTGFVVSIPDYLGFGASDNMFHPYLDKESTVLTVTDMLRAVKELASEKHLNINLRLDSY